MAALSSIALGLGAAALTGGTVLGAVKQGEAARASEKQVEAFQQKQDKLAADAEQRVEQERVNSEAISLRDAARRRRRSSNAGGAMASTIFTSPLGINGMPGYSGKTLLGQ